MYNIQHKLIDIKELNMREQLNRKDFVETELFDSIKKINYETSEYETLFKRVEKQLKDNLVDGEEYRDYQSRTVAKTIYALENGFKRVLIEKPTGAGKTPISRNLFNSPELRKVLNIKGDRPLRLLFIANRNRLLTQAERTYSSAANVEIITISTSLKEFPEDLLAKGWDITCLDEAHHESMTSFQLYLESITSVPLIGLTATPHRPDNCILKFELIINEITRKEAVEQGYLAETDIISIVNVASRNKSSFLKRVLRDFKEDINQCIIAVKTKKEIEDLESYMKGIGYEGVVGILNQNPDELNEVLDSFSKGDVKVLINCNKINEGIDVKGCSTLFLGRDFDSIIQLNQTIGRGARPDSPCLVIEIIDPVKSKKNALHIVEKAKSHKFVYYKNDSMHVYDYNSKEKLEERVSLQNVEISAMEY